MEKTITVILVTVLMLYSPYSFGDNCPEPVQLIKKDEKANCSGFLFSPEAEKKTAFKVDELNHVKQLNDFLVQRQKFSDTEIKILQERLELAQYNTFLLTDRLQNVKEDEFWQKYMYFGLGIFVTGIAVYGASKLK